MRLATYLRRKKIKPAVFSRQIGISKGYLSRLLSGEREPSGRLMVKIERVTDGAVLLRDFFAGRER